MTRLEDLPARYQAQALRQMQGRPLPPGECSERDWQAWVEEVARSYGWTTYHTLRSKGSRAGFPDIVAVRADGETGRGQLQRLLTLDRVGFEATLARWEAAPRGSLLVAELKTERGKVSDAQQLWLSLFALVTPSVHIWRPSEWRAVWEALR